MTKSELSAFKKKLEDHLKSEGISDPEVILVSGGCLAQAISPAIKETSNKIFDVLTKLHRTLPSGESAFPFQIHVYANENDAFKQDASLKTKPHDYPSGIHTTYLTSGDAIITMREIDIDALLYGGLGPFEFKVKSTNKNFLLDSLTSYKELDAAGGHYGIEKIEPLSENIWKITLAL
jgi:hypothetical protein